MTKSIAQRYSIVIKDTETGATVVNAAVDWTDDQKWLAAVVIGRLTNAGDPDRPSAFADLEPGVSKDHYH